MKSVTYKGFTLIELLVVIAIIGIISAISVISFNNARKKSRDARRMTDIKQLNEAIQLYISANGHAPYLNDQCKPNSNSNTCLAESYNDKFGYWSLLGNELDPYLKNLPSDPGDISNAASYHYVYEAPGYVSFQCNNTNGCNIQSNDIMTMYSVYATSLEMTPGQRWEISNTFLSK